MQKKWIGMGIAVAAAAAILALRANGDNTPMVSGVTLHPQRVEQTVSCVGVVEAGDSIPVVLPVECHIRRVNVKKGQRVKKGDVLATIDREASVAAAEDPSQRVVMAAMEEAIYAPTDGVIVDVKANIGKVLDAGTPCVMIVRDSDIQVRIGIQEKDLKQLRKGMDVRLKGEGFKQEYYKGELVEISSAALTDTAGGTVVEGVVTLQDGQADASMRLGLTAKALVITSVTENGYIIPYEAVISDSVGDHVYVYDDGKATLRQVTDATRVAQGLLVDEEWDGVTVITESQSLTDGQVVQVSEESR